jgi:pimeloyl-ACP methyl ester carboxylesterase
VITWRNASGSGKAILVFGGGGADFWLSMEILHRKLRGAGCHLIYVRDRNFGFFLERASDWDGVRAIAEGLRRQLAAFGATRLYCLGNSMGGYGALRYGIELGAEAVLAFGAVTDPENQTTDPGLMPRLRRTQPGLAIDPVPLYRDAQRRPRVTLCYGSENQADRAAAHRMKGIPGVSLVEAKGVRVHAVIRWFLANGGFDALVAAMLRDEACPVPIEGAVWDPPP